MHNLSDMAELVGNSALGWPSRPRSSRAALAPCMGPMPMLAMRFQGPEEYKIPELRAGHSTISRSRVARNQIPRAMATFQKRNSMVASCEPEPKAAAFPDLTSVGSWICKVHHSLSKPSTSYQYHTTSKYALEYIYNLYIHYIYYIHYILPPRYAIRMPKFSWWSPVCSKLAATVWATQKHLPPNGSIVNLHSHCLQHPAWWGNFDSKCVISPRVMNLSKYRIG